MTSPAVPAGCAARFKPERKIAEGGFGSVWYATQVELSRPVALKILHPELVEEQEQVQRFMTEARVTAALRHPHVVTLIDHGVEDGVPWIAYEFVAGESLRARLGRGPLPWREACEVAAQVAAALEAAHAQGVLHRDIKPDNILSDQQGHYKVADFGIAKVRSGRNLTAHGVLLGTPSYLSPVQIRGEAPGPDSDVYALGITLYELLTGSPPYVADTPLDTLSQHLTQQVPRVSAVVPDVPRELDDLLLQMLAKKRADRMGSATDVRAALLRLAGPEAPPPVLLGSGRVRRSGVNSRTLATGIGASTIAVPVEAPRPRWPLALAAGAVAALALAALWPRPPAPLPSPSASVAPPPVEIPDLHVEPLAHSVRVVLIRPEGVRLAIELGRGEPPVWEQRAVVDGEGVFQVRELDRLTPGTTYRVRARALDRTGSTPACSVRTLREVELKATPDPSVSKLPHEQLRADLLEVLPNAAPDTRLTSFLIHDLQQPPPVSMTYLSAVVSYGWRNPSRLLAETLMKVAVTDEETRAAVLALACFVRASGAVEASRHLLETMKVPHRAYPLLVGLERAHVPALFDALESLMQRDFAAIGTFGAAALVSSDPERARASFERWFAAAGPAARAERTAAACGFAFLAGARTLTQLERLARNARPEQVHPLLLALALQRLDPAATRIARGIPSDESVWWDYYNAALGTASVERLLARMDGENAGIRNLARRALALMPPGSMPAALLEREDVADIAAFSYAGVKEAAALAALRARALSDRDRSGVALWALARSKDPAAAARALELLRAPASTEPVAAGRQGIAAWVAGDLLLAEARPLLTRLAAANTTGFARACARDALAWIAAGRAPLSFLIPPGITFVQTGVPMRRLETIHVTASEVVTNDDARAGMDLGNIARFLNPNVAWIGVGPWLDEVRRRPRPQPIHSDGELVVSRGKSLEDSVGEIPAKTLIRVVVER